MSVNPINNSWMEGIKGFSFVEDSIKKKSETLPTQGDFNSFLSAAMDTMSVTSRLEQEAGKAQLDYITGKSDDMLSVVLAEQRAYTALNFTVQVTNKVIEAYKQIIAMQL